MKFTVFLKGFSEPLQEIGDNPYYFMAWFFVAVIIGAVGIWVPLLITALDGPIPFNWRSAVLPGNLASFNTVLLSECLAAAFLAVKAGISKKTAGIRAIIAAFGTLLIIVNTMLVARANPTTTYFHVLLTMFVVAIASYMYCLRSPSWEESADKIPERENAELGALAVKVKTTVTDGSGTII